MILGSLELLTSSSPPGIGGGITDPGELPVALPGLLPLELPGAWRTSTNCRGPVRRRVELRPSADCGAGAPDGRVMPALPNCPILPVDLLPVGPPIGPPRAPGGPVGADPPSLSVGVDTLEIIGDADRL